LPKRTLECRDLLQAQQVHREIHCDEKCYGVAPALDHYPLESCVVSVVINDPPRVIYETDDLLGRAAQGVPQGRVDRSHSSEVHFYRARQLGTQLRSVFDELLLL
jgi:hypothetical protein